MIPARYLLVLGTFSLSILLYVDRICISTAKSEVTQDLALNDKQFGWVLSVFSLGYALFQTPGGWMADRWGPRAVLSGIVVIWSIFTGLTAAAYNWLTLLLVRFLFGVGEAGAFPGVARAVYAWIPIQERGIIQGINFSGSRVGGAASLVTIPWMIDQLGWKLSFVVLMAVGWIWACWWYLWFRDEPQQHSRISAGELEHILRNRQSTTTSDQAPPSNISFGIASIANSETMWLLSLQYFCSNFTFFFCLTWMFPYMKQRYALSGFEAGMYAATPLIFGALGNWLAGWLVDRIFRDGQWVRSRRLPAIIGFALAAMGMVGSVTVDSAWGSAAWLSLTVFGSDMTLASSWSCCIDIGKRHSGVVSGTMNMAGNLGSFVTALAFPYLANWTGSNVPFFVVAAGLNLLAAFVWLAIDPRKSLDGAT